MLTIRNPVLPGFHPDPSFLRVGRDYYLATSTFEWFPGVRLHHSRDLVHWRCIGHALTDTRHLDLRAVPNSGGVWAPSLSYARGRFWLVYTVVRTWGMGQPFKDLANYLVTAEKITGPWSDPIYLNGTGFDASLFHDEDGRQWVVSMEWDHRPGRPRFAGIVLQEYDHQQLALVGRPRTILKKDVLIEGPNLYRRGGWYYLMLAEGGTGWNHGISMARARRITGPYELDPQGSVLTARDDKQIELQKAGHGELVETPARRVVPCPPGQPAAGAASAVRAGARDLPAAGGVVGRRLAAAGGRRHAAAGRGGGTARRDRAAVARGGGCATSLTGRSWMHAGRRCAGRPMRDGCRLRARPGWLRLRGRESVHSLHDQSLVAQRLTAVHRARPRPAWSSSPPTTRSRRA
jgi:xylan 1,4-beta-xylosidase